jgi:hypothetical protein
MVESCQSTFSTKCGWPKFNFCHYLSREDGLEHYPVRLGTMVDKFKSEIFHACKNLMVFTWVNAQRSLLPSSTVDESVKAFYKYHRLGTSKKKINSSIRQYHRDVIRYFSEQKTTLSKTTHAVIQKSDDESERIPDTTASG